MRSWQPWYKNSSWKSTFQAKMGSIKDRNGMDLTEAEDVITRGGKNTKKNYTKRSSWPRYPRWCDHPPRARHPGMWSQVGLRKHQRTKLVEVMAFQLSYFKSWKMMLWKCCTQYASKLGQLAVVIELEKVSFHSNPKERQCHRIFKLPRNCTRLTHSQHNAQNSPN